MPRRKKTDTSSLFRGREGLRFAVMALLAIIVGAIAFGSFDKLVSDPEPEAKPISISVPAIKLPPIDRKILETAKDDNAIRRLEAEPNAYEHLLSCAAYIVPGALQAMGLEERPVAALRSNPAKFRGRPVAFEGQIVDLRDPAAIPGVSTWKKTEGMLETEKGEQVFFAVLDEIPSNLGIGKFARIEGFFFKLRDFKFPKRFDEVPHVVGFKLRKAFKRFEDVKEIDFKLLSSIRDNVPEPRVIELDSLYHATSWMQNQDPKALAAGAVDLRRSHVEKMLAAAEDAPRGKTFRILAELYDAHTRLAEPNPLGIQYWTRAWVRHADQETIQVNIPGRLEGEWHTGDYVMFHGVYLQRYMYESGLDDNGTRIERTVPLFVAPSLLPWKIVDNPDNFWIRIALGAIALLLIGAISFLVIRDRKAEEEVRKRLLEQRRRKRLRKTTR